MCSATDGSLWLFVDPDGVGQLRQHSRHFNCKGKSQVEDEEARQNRLNAIFYGIVNSRKQ